MTSPRRLAVFVSGEGSLLQALIDHQKDHLFEVSAVVTSRANANAVVRAKTAGVPVVEFLELSERELLDHLISFDIQFIVLAGFLKKIPSSLIRHFQGRMINTHPSLLPKYGGKGMYGIHVHRAVLQAGDIQSGCTTHFVTENYDEGEIISQAVVDVKKDDSAEDLQRRVKGIEATNLLESLRKVLSA